MRLQYDLSLTGGDEGQSSVKEVRPKEVVWTGSKSVTHTHTHCPSTSAQGETPHQLQFERRPAGGGRAGTVNITLIDND